MLSKLLTVLLLIVVAGILLRIAASYYSNQAAKSPTFSAGKAHIADCPDTPNCQTSVASRTSQQVAPFSFNSSPDDVINKVAVLLSSQPNTQIELHNNNYIHATIRTPLLGFVDDVEFQVSEDQTELHVRSASRLGISDLGANKKRIARLRELMNNQI